MARRLFAIGIFTLPALAVAAACTFPDVTFGPETSAEAGTPETGTPETGTPETGTPDTSVDADAGSEDATPMTDAFVGDVVDRKDGEGPVDAAGCGAKPTCDCDEDGYRASDCPADASTDANLKPGDCDDLDSLRHPGANFTVATPIGHTGDWDCNTNVEKAFAEKCTGSALNCTGESFKAAVGCGVEAEYYTCGVVSLTCVPTVYTANKQQACK